MSIFSGMISFFASGFIYFLEYFICVPWIIIIFSGGDEGSGGELPFSRTSSASISLFFSVSTVPVG